MTCGRKKVLFSHTQYVEPSYMLYDGLALLQFKHSKQSITLFNIFSTTIFFKHYRDVSGCGRLYPVKRRT